MIALLIVSAAIIVYLSLCVWSLYSRSELIEKNRGVVFSGRQAVPGECRDCGNHYWLKAPDAWICSACDTPVPIPHIVGEDDLAG